MAKWVLLFWTGLLGVTLAAGLRGLPDNLAGFQGWTKVAQNLDTGGPHAGKSKLVFANGVAAKGWKGGKPLPVGSIVVKTAGSASSPDFVAVMEKTKQGWQYAEFTAKGGSYSLILAGKVCSSCHANVKDQDFLYTR